MSAVVIDFAARARLRKVLRLVETLDRYYVLVGERQDAAALAERLRAWNDSDWSRLARFADVKYPSEETRALVIGVFEDRALRGPKVVEVSSCP